MPRHEFKVGDRVRARHNIVDDDYHKGCATLAKKGETGEVIEIRKRYDGDQYVFVKLDDRWPGYQPIQCVGHELEPIADVLDQFVADVFTPEK